MNNLETALNELAVEGMIFVGWNLEDLKPDGEPGEDPDGFNYQQLSLHFVDTVFPEHKRTLVLKSWCSGSQCDSGFI